MVASWKNLKEKSYIQIEILHTLFFVTREIPGRWDVPNFDPLLNIKIVSMLNQAQNSCASSRIQSKSIKSRTRLFELPLIQTNF